MPPALIVVGASLGGLQAMRRLLAALPAQFSLPMALVQHRHADSDDSLVTILQSASARPVVGVLDKQVIAPGHVHVAPPNYHTLVEEDHFTLSIDEPVQWAQPSVDVLFESAAEAYGRRVIAVVLTGNNQDGARGAARVKAYGGYLIVQDPATAEAAPMPRAALAAAAADQVLPLGQIAPHLLQLAEATATGNHES